ncbi:Protein CBG12699 [Caenorhabditis briggsae]|uniref:Protein CBG12699 n=1 Tax=Caenorhabditis briggsae TaxID=6238 RepID=A8XGD5_CAEBR|nr:Protein CBG12699 [Caenorhabditis briggsae]CAP31641.1 Protein CBG12699 [Caenorhabditis briggsae]
MSTPSRNRATVPQRGYVAQAAASAAIAVHPPVRCRASTNSYRVIGEKLKI